MLHTLPLAQQHLTAVWLHCRRGVICQPAAQAQLHDGPFWHDAWHDVSEPARYLFSGATCVVTSQCVSVMFFVGGCVSHGVFVQTSMSSVALIRRLVISVHRRF